MNMIEKDIIMRNTTPEERAEIRKEIRTKDLKKALILSSVIIIIDIIATVAQFFILPESKWGDLIDKNIAVGMLAVLMIFLTLTYRHWLFEEVKE